MLNVILLAVLIVLPLLILVLFINSRHKKLMAAIRQLGEQLDEVKSYAAPVDQAVKTDEAKCAEKSVQESAVAEIVQLTEEKQDAVIKGEENAASAYNTGKSGKIYTKEELELLIKE